MLKLHGDAIEVNGRVFSRDQYETAYGSTSRLPGLLDKVLTSTRMLFLGCSLIEDRTMIEMKKAGLRQDNAYHFALLEKPDSPTALADRRNLLLHTYGIMPIWFAERDFGAIDRILRFLASVASP